MPDETDTQPAPDNSTPPPDSPGTGGAGASSQLREAIQRGSDAAVSQHLAEAAAPRGRGRPPIHGRYSAKVPVEAVGAGPAAARGGDAEAQAAAAVHPLGWEAPVEGFDEKSAEAMVEVGISGLNYLGAMIVRIIGGREVQDQAVIDAAVKNCQVSEDRKSVV